MSRVHVDFGVGVFDKDRTHSIGTSGTGRWRRSATRLGLGLVAGLVAGHERGVLPSRPALSDETHGASCLEAGPRLYQVMLVNERIPASPLCLSTLRHVCCCFGQSALSTIYLAFALLYLSPSRLYASCPTHRSPARPCCRPARRRSAYSKVLESEAGTSLVCISYNSRAEGPVPRAFSGGHDDKSFAAPRPAKRRSKRCDPISRWCACITFPAIIASATRTSVGPRASCSHPDINIPTTEGDL